MEKKKGLGKGLSALIPEKIKPESERYREIEISCISSNPYQPRKFFSEEELQELTLSIAKDGLLQPVVVVKEPQGYKLIAGERRFRAIQSLGWKKIPAIILEKAEEVEFLRKSLVENVQRSALNPIEEAMAYKKLLQDYGYSLDQIANEVGKDVTTVSNTIRLLNLPLELQEDLKQGRITSGHARALLMIGDKKKMLKLARKIKEKHISVRETERIAREKKVYLVDPNLEEILDKLRQKLGTKVTLQKRKKGGKIEIIYLDEQDLERIFKILIC